MANTASRAPSAISKANEFKDWFAHLSASDLSQPNLIKHNPRALLRILSIFGINTPEKARAFFNSPAGEVIQSMIIEQIINEEQLAQNQQQQSMQHSLLHRLLAIFLLGMFHKHQANAKDLNAIIQQSIDENAKKHHQTVQKRANDSNTSGLIIQPSLEVSEFNKFLESSIEHQNNYIEEQEDALRDLHAQIQQLEAEYKLQQNSNAIIEKLFKRFDVAARSGNDALERLIKELEAQFESDSEEIADAIEKTGTVDEPHSHIAQSLLIDAIKQALNISKDLIRVNESGDVTDSPMETAFFLKPENKIVRDQNGNHYLIPAGKNLQDLNPIELAEAQENFQKQYTNIATTLYSYRQGFTKNEQHIAGQIGALRSKFISTESEIAICRNELNMMQSIRATVAHHIAQPNPDLQKAEQLTQTRKTTPTPKPGFTPPQTTPASMRSSVAHVVNMFQTCQFTQNGQVIYLNTTLQSGNNPNAIIPGQPIPAKVLENLKRNPVNAPTQNAQEEGLKSHLNPFSTQLKPK